VKKEGGLKEQNVGHAVGVKSLILNRLNQKKKFNHFIVHYQVVKAQMKGFYYIFKGKFNYR